MDNSSSERDAASNEAPSEDPGAEAPSAAAVLESMTLLATLSTATDLRHSVAERRAGRDPSAQEPPERAAASVRLATSRLMDLGMQLLMGRTHLAHHDEGALAAAVRHFDLLLKLRQSERALHNLHQRLLSLYPDVSEPLLEDVREVHDAVATLVDDGRMETVLPELDAIANRIVGTVVWARHEV